MRKHALKILSFSLELFVAKEERQGESEKKKGEKEKEKREGKKGEKGEKREKGEKKRNVEVLKRDCGINQSDFAEDIVK